MCDYPETMPEKPKLHGEALENDTSDTLVKKPTSNSVSITES